MLPQHPFTHRLVTLCDGRPGLRSTLQITAQPPPPAEIENPEPAILDFTASNDTLDRYDEIISPAGWQLDHYRRNPVFQNAHQYGDIIFTLGKALITEIRTASEELSTINHPLSTYLFQRIEFAVEANPMARIAYNLYKGKFLNAVSVGFIPLRWLDADGTEHPSREGPGKPSTINSQPSTKWRRKYLEQELLELSAVAIPANPDALQLALKACALEKADLQDTLDLLRQLTAPIAPYPLSTINYQLLETARQLRDLLKHT